MSAVPQGVLRRECIHWIHKVAAKGWVANHDGNLTVRLPAGRLLATPTAMSKAELTEHDLLVLDARGKVLHGRHRPFSELSLHRAVYEVREDVGAVLHAHPPAATAFGVAGKVLDPCIIAEAVVSLGDRIPLIPYAFPGCAEGLDALREAIRFDDVVILENHGALSVGRDPEQAFLRMELCEHLARIHLEATALGGARRLPDRDIERLLQRRKAAGLGPEARGLVRPGGSCPRARVGEPPPRRPRRLVGPCSGPIEPIEPPR